MQNNNKHKIVSELATMFQGNSCSILVGMDKISCNDSNSMRKSLRIVDAKMVFIKNSLVKKASSNLTKFSDNLRNNLAIVFSDDIVNSSKVLFDCKIPSLKILGAGFKGCFFSELKLRELSELPDLGSLRAQLVFTLQGFMSSRMLGTLTYLQSSMLYILSSSNNE